MSQARTAKSKTEATTSNFNPANYMYGFTEAQRISIENFKDSRDKNIITLYKTDDSTVVVAYTVGRRKTRQFIWIDNDGKISFSHEEYESSNEIGGGIEESELSYADYLILIEAKYPLEKTEKITANNSSDEFLRVKLSDIFVSSLEPQQSRRKRFSNEEISELAENIKTHGLINPITVRRVGGQYEIVAGERRFLATGVAGFDSILVNVKNLSDETALEIQLFENLERRDVHPLDEANWYQYLLATTTTNVESLALKLGKSLNYITNRLKLNELIPELQLDLEHGLLPLGHALEISKYPADAQTEILEYHLYRDTDDKQDGVESLADLRRDIQRDILLNLAAAPFSLKAKNLRPDGLACVDCPQRTNYHPTLFGGEGGGKQPDFCLNKVCFEGKTLRHIQIHQELQSNKIRKETGSNDYAAPLVSSSWYTDEDDVPGAIGRSQYEAISDLKNQCAYAEQGIAADGNQAGQMVLVCRDENCETHGAKFKRFNSNSSATAVVTKTAEEIEAEQQKQRETRLIRKEEIFDVAVGEKVRLRVLKRAAANFNVDQTVFNHPQAARFLQMLTERLWTLQSSYSKHTAKIIRDTLELDKTELGTGEWGDSNAVLHNVTPEKRSQLFFLLLTAFNGELYEGGEWHSQKEIREIAEIFAVDYKILDAEERLSKAPMKHKDIFRRYLQDLEAGEKTAKIPRMHTDKWKPEDK